jgi:hypothetical protein
VGDEFLGWSIKNFFVENFLDNPPPDWVEEGVGAGGDMIFDES